MWQSLEILNVLKTLDLKQIFWEAKTFFTKLEYCFSVENTKTENASFPYGTAILQTNDKRNKMGSTNWTYLLCFFQFCLSLRASFKELI